MTCPLSLVILAAMLFIQSTRLYTVPELTPEDGNHIGQAMANPLTSHILDTTLGKPAPNVKTTLYKFDGNSKWTQIRQKHTDEDGRLSNLIAPEDFTKGLYKLHFDTKSYYENLKMQTFYPYVEIVFEITEPEEHYHVPLLLSPYGYSTYRGS